ncbi:MAG TPA: SMC-Scp complex subunit ScpB [Gammaproteobacteria bacterium]|jgi:segregation and condensation protein B|nr:SMC-Scp complex subunit ScpB [Acidiferrobacteraceae bacterium]MDP6551035.1 SMC-Scp complex subunit ScpB [Arenicellales bacterium]MDP6791854.1 SMC-Scp complex subunit ScpB [Arenicellales bacterium]MDP6918306.1 SMC-Scp complex subunit ScpB [Arenicellales bacterium]HCX87889.1 SMC-Scp complex subunit ScpB [Gammaproteobacteria bacterium]|tara:strand:- start:28242 stop:29009 length:768 start_codon:yes stop_codon:yes gene_type:complete
MTGIQPIANAVEAALFSSERPLTVRDLQILFDQKVDKEMIRSALEQLRSDYVGRGVELVEVAGGFRFQTKAVHAPALRALRESRPPRYSRALLETLAIIAYRQPVTRGDIEDIRGVTVTTEIMRVLLDREWIRQSGSREVPGHPALYVTTAIFLEYFGLTSLKELPGLDDERQLADIARELGIEMPSSLAPVPMENPEGEAGDDGPDEVDSENGDVDDLPVSAEYVSDDSDSESAQIQDPDDESATRAALNSEFD